MFRELHKPRVNGDSSNNFSVKWRMSVVRCVQ